MVDQREKLWTFDAVEPGQVGNETVVEVTAENIAEYARLALNPSDAYQSGGSGLAAMPTMVLSYVPLLREEIAEANGFIAFEVSKTARSQTPRHAAWTASTHAPCVAEREVAAGVRITPRVGPIHGDHAIANVEPIPNDRG